MSNPYNPDREELNGATRGLFDSLKVLLIPAKPIRIRDIEDLEGLDRAIECGAALQKTGFYRGQKIGVVRKDIPDLIDIAPLRRGETVLYIQDGRALTVEKPYNSEEIKKRLKSRFPVFGLEVINIPASYVHPVI